MYDRQIELVQALLGLAQFDGKQRLRPSQIVQGQADLTCLDPSTAIWVNHLEQLTDIYIFVLINLSQTYTIIKPYLQSMHRQVPPFTSLTFSVSQECPSISFTKDLQMPLDFNQQQRINLDLVDPPTITKRSVEKRRKIDSSLSDLTSFMECSAFASFQSVQAALRGDEEQTVAVSQVREYSQQNGAYHPGKFVSGEDLEHEIEFQGYDDAKEEFLSVDESRSFLLNTDAAVSGEEAIKQKMRELNNKIRRYTVQKKKLQARLRNNLADEETYDTRECPCCGKPIQKLCFKCQHINCTQEVCPRKKKQKLNAKMLRRMREQKKGGNPRRRHSRSRDDKEQHKKTGKVQAQQDSLHSSEEEYYSSEDLQSDISSHANVQELFMPTKRRQQEKQVAVWNRSMTDASLSNSNIFCSSDDDKKERDPNNL